MRTKILVPILSSVMAMAGCLSNTRCAHWNDQSTRTRAHVKRVAGTDRFEWKEKYRRPAGIPFPDDNPYSKDRELLGRTLFFDPRLSRSGSISCANCHSPALSWTDGLSIAEGVGIKNQTRRTPTLLNVAWSDLLFWDGRAASLESQALIPITSEDEMNQTRDALIQRVNGIREYKQLFNAAYPGEPINEGTIVRAIATFERTVVSGESPFDRWIGGDESAISEQAKGGFDLFNGRAACAKCHSGWNFTDNGFHDIGVEGNDRGRGVVLPLDAMQFAFKTPTLRNVARRGPFMHNGTEPSLEAVIESYDLGGRDRRSSLAPEIVPLHLSSEDKEDLLAFLMSLTSVDKPVEMPPLPK